MRPLHKRYFGQTGIQVQFWSGSSVITGYIKKQKGFNRYLVTNNAQSVTDLVTLQAATVTGAGQARIVVTNFAAGTEYAYEIGAHLVKTFSDHIYTWQIGGSVPDAAHAKLTQNS